MWPQFSVHGNNTDINLKIHCGQLIVGEVKLFDPRSDCEPDNFNILPSGEDADLIHDDPTWPQAIQQIPHKDLKNPIDFWATLDIIYMMAMQGFKIRAWGYNGRCVFVNGTLLPDSSDRYGRFRFHMDVTTRQWHNSDLIAPTFDIEGIDTSAPTPKLEDGNPMERGIGRFVRRPPTWAGACEETPLPCGTDEVTFLAFGSNHPNPGTPSHIPVVKDGIPFEGDAIKSPRKRLYADDDRPGISMELLRGESIIDHGTDYPHLRHLNRQQLEAYLAKETGVYKDTGIGVTRSDGGAGWTGPKVDAAFDAYKQMVVNGMRERILDHGAIEGKVVTVDKRDAAGNVIGHEEIPGDHVLLEDPVYDVPTTDLDLEADPANWDGFLDDDSAGSPRSEDGDTSK